mmetsp:Transcript_4722/g.6946  ORF Transcript_4722/g.6946 Transcript_4722/m.6946 type:complete len:87 (-) Transcript_4722:25-285(-)
MPPARTESVPIYGKYREDTDASRASAQQLSPTSISRCRSFPPFRLRMGCTLQKNGDAAASVCHPDGWAFLTVRLPVLLLLRLWSRG